MNMKFHGVIRVACAVIYCVHRRNMVSIILNVIYNSIMKGNRGGVVVNFP